jgi:hypothetical protein
MILSTLMLQLAVFSNLSILHGTADLMLLLITAWALQGENKSIWIWAGIAALLIGSISALPVFVYLAVYVVIILIAKFIHMRIWQMPILAMYFTTLVGTLIFNLMSFLVLKFSQAPISFSDSINLVVLPSILLNLILALPVYLLVTDLIGWMYPEEVVE